MIFSTFRDSKNFSATDVVEYLERQHGVSITPLAKKNDIYTYPKSGDLIIAQKMSLFDAYKLQAKGVHIAVLNFRKNTYNSPNIDDAMENHVITRISIEKGEEVKDIYHFVEVAPSEDETS